MTDIASLEQKIAADIAAASDEAALEAVRVAALGKSGSVSALLKTLGGMTPGRAQGAGPGDQRPEGPRQRGAQRAPRRLQGRGARRAARHRDRRRHAAGARGAGRGRPHPSDQPGDRRAHRDLRRHGLRRRRRAGHRDRRLQLHQAQFPRGPSGARDARHVLFPAEAGRLADAAAHAHLAGAGAHHADAEAADPRHHSGPHLSQRLRPDPHADVPSGRGPGHRQGRASRPPEMDPRGILQGVLRGRQREDALSAVVLPVHRAVARSRHPVPARQGRDALRRGRRLAGDSRLRHGASERAAQLRARSRRVPGLRLGHGDRPHRHAEIRHAGPARVLRGRRALARALRLPPARLPDAWREG